ncbi:MAG: Rrf2 family transcriptional regulator [Gordonia sp. (in: high G+C Gram-positive bacteria)]|uniref:RrF2 family transcriptional regulator n=1 Tax=Gordonia sp. (in: high G+C Gram-positive bacteria) TaxID=84139 RepID=UPI0039E72AF5
MQLTRFTDIGLRVLMRLAADSGERTHTARGLAEELGVPYTHVAKVVSRLSEIGVVHSRRGRSGGLTITALGRTAGVGWVTRELEGDAPVVDCDGPVPCPLKGGCRLRGALARAQNAFYESLDSLTVAEIAGAAQVLVLAPPVPNGPTTDSRAPGARATSADSGHSPTAENRNR